MPERRIAVPRVSIKTKRKKEKKCACVYRRYFHIKNFLKKQKNRLLERRKKISRAEWSGLAHRAAFRRSIFPGKKPIRRALVAGGAAAGTRSRQGVV